VLRCRLKLINFYPSSGIENDGRQQPERRPAPTDRGQDNLLRRQGRGRQNIIRGVLLGRGQHGHPQKDGRRRLIVCCANLRFCVFDFTHQSINQSTSKHPAANHSLSSRNERRKNARKHPQSQLGPRERNKFIRISSPCSRSLSSLCPSRPITRHHQINILILLMSKKEEKQFNLLKFKVKKKCLDKDGLF
jgi:hypothetical protein